VGSYGLKVIGRVAMEDGRVGMVPMQNCSWRLHAIAYVRTGRMWSQNGRMSRPIYQMKAENEIFRLVYPSHTYSYVVLN
jgi:hypothetical protein